MVRARGGRSLGDVMDAVLPTADEPAIARLRCAPFHSSLGVDPIGTAAAYEVFLCVEVPLPWERDISFSEPFRSVVGEGSASVRLPDGRRLRPQGLVPRPGAEGWRRIVLFERPVAATSDGYPGGNYERTEWWVDPAEVEPLCRAIVAADPEAVGGFAERRVEVPGGVVDLFVCTHGKRDTCCGRSGAALHDLLSARLAEVDPGGDHIRLWRVSHTGGHRFAPTALTFPDGYAWSHLDLDATLAVALRTGDPAEVAAHCRGISSLSGGPAQAADRAVLVEAGWDWTSASRRVSVTAFDRRSLATELLIEGEYPDGRFVSFEVRVEVEGHVPQITCGAISEPEYTVEPVWRVTAVNAV
jgi:hypothetical protein